MPKNHSVVVYQELKNHNERKASFTRPTPYREIYKKLTPQVLFILLSQFFLSGKNIAEQGMLAKLHNPDSYAGNALYGPMQSLIILFLHSFSMSVRVLSAEQNGKITKAKEEGKDPTEYKENIGRIYLQAMIATTITTLPLAVGLNFIEYFYRWLNEPEGATLEAQNYLRGISFGLVPNVAFIMITREIFNALKKAQFTTVLSFTETFLRVGLGFYFTYKGLANIPPSTFLMGLSSSVSNTVFGLVAVTSLLTFPQFRQFKFLRQLPRKKDWRWLGEIFKHGSNMALAGFADFMNNVMMGLLAGRKGNNATLTALGFSTVLHQFLLMLTYAGIDGSGAFMSNSKGEKKYQDFRRVFYASLSLSFSILSPLLIVYNTVPRQIFNLFHPEIESEETLQKFEHIMWIHSGIVVADVFRIVANAANNSLKDTTATNRINLFSMGAVAVSVAMILSFALDINEPETLLLSARLLPILIGAILSFSRFLQVSGEYEQDLELSKIEEESNVSPFFSYQNSAQPTFFGQLSKKLLGETPLDKEIREMNEPDGPN